MRMSVLTAVTATLVLAGGVCLAENPVPIRVAFVIQTQPLRGALKEFAKQSGLQVLRRDEDVRVDGIIAPGVEGQFSAREALDRILANTGFSYEFINARTVRVITPSDKEDFSKTQWLRSAADQGGAQAPAGAQTSATERRSDNKRRQPSESEGMEQVIVTAQKREENLHDVPMSISLLSGDDLDRSSVSGLTDALNRVPGVATTVGVLSGGTQVAVRGVTAGGPLFQGSSPVAYYLDTVPFGLLKTAIAPDPNAYDMERVEVLRGPQGTLYGASAQNGVVRVLTKDANLNDFELKLRTAGGVTDDAGGNYRADAAINVPIIEGKLAARAVVGYENWSGWIDSPNKRDVNDAELRNYRLKINAQPTDLLSIGLSAWHSSNDYGGPSNSADNGRILALGDQPISTEYNVYGIKLGYDAPLFSISSMTGYLDYKNDIMFDLMPLFASPAPVPYFTGLKSRVISEELVLNSRPESPWHWTLGAFYRDARDRLVQDIPLVGFHPDLTDTSKSYAVFGQVGRRFLNDKFEWTIGLRNFHDDVENINNLAGPANFAGQSQRVKFNATTPRAVLTWYPSRDLTVYASYGEGFRSGFPQNTGFVPAGVPSVRPDKLHNYEIGAKANTLGGRLSFDMAVFYIDWRDVQQTLSIPFQGVRITVPTNGKSASGMGVDFSMAARPVDGLNLSLNFGWSDLAMDSVVFSGTTTPPQVLFSEGQRLNASPEYTAGASVEYSWHLGDGGILGRLGASASYISKQCNAVLGAPAVCGDSLLTSRASAGVESLDRWSASVFVDNLTNESGVVLADANLVPSWATRTRPRTYGLQLEYRF